MEHRIEALADVLSGEVEIRKEYDTNGHLVRTVVSPAPASQKLRAIDILNKMDGTYERSLVGGSRTGLRDLISKHAHLLERGPGG